MRGLKRTGVVVGLAAAAVGLILPASSPGALLYDQSGPIGGGISSTVFSPSNDHDAQAADDFTVPAGQRWKIASVDVFGGTVTGHAGNVVISAGGGPVPGAQLFQQGSLFFAPATTVNLPLSGAPVLEPGSYWLSVFTTSFSLNNVDRWGWGLQTALHGQPAVWRNPQDGFTSGCTVFKPLAQCGISFKDLKFRLNGDLVPPNAGARKCKRKPKKHSSAAAAKKKRCKKSKKK